MLTFFDAAVSASSGNGVPAGLFIPVSDLPGVEAGEFDAGDSQALKEAKGVLGYANALNTYFAANSANIVGFSSALGKASPSNTLSNLTYTFVHQYIGKLSDKSLDQIPLPTAGDNSGVGGFAVADIFANAADVAAEGAIPSEGMVIPYADISGFGGSVPDAIAAGNDNRDLFAAIDRALPTLLTLRNASTASGFTASNQGAATSFVLAAAATAAENPTTGIASNEVNTIIPFQMQSQVTIQVALDQSTQTFDVNVATT